LAERREQPLICPECAAKVAWNGTQFVCLGCEWTEYKAKPPSTRNILLPKEIRDRKQSR